MEAPTPASDSEVASAPQSPVRKKLPAPSTPTSSVRRKMASNAASSGGRDAAAPRPSATTGSSSAAAVAPRRPTVSTTTARTAAAASKPTASTTSRVSTLGSSLNKPPTRPVAATAARRPAVSSRATPSDAEPELSPLTSGDDNRRATPVARPPGTAARTATKSPPGKTTSSRQSLPPSTTAAARRPLTTRPAADTSTTRPAPRASLAPSTRTAAVRPSTTAARAPPATAAKAPVGHASKLSVSAAAPPPPPPPAAPTPDTDNEPSSPIKLGEETPRPDTASSGPADMDVDTKRRSAQIMQDFFKETNLREQLQEQCDDLSREVDNLQSEKAKLKQQLIDAQALLAERDRAIAGASDAAGSNAAQTTLVDEMNTKHARETKDLEEQTRKLAEEKQAETVRAAELQQVLDDLNHELERQGQRWDAEKKKLVEQAAEIAALSKDMASLKKERDALSEELSTARQLLNDTQARLAELEQTSASELRSRDEQISTLEHTIEEMRAEAESSNDRNSQSLSQAEAAGALVEQLQNQLQALQQQHTDEIMAKDESIASHVKIQEELKRNLSDLQKRADETTAELNLERIAHAEAIQQKIDELQKRSEDDLRTKEEQVSSHLQSIDRLQDQIMKLQQGETDGAALAQQLHKQIEELKEAHNAAIKVKSDEKDELLQQLDAINDQLSADATELQQLKEEAEGLRKTITTLEHVAQQESLQHASEAAKLHAELNETKKHLNASQEKHAEEVRGLKDDYESKIQALRADLEGEAKGRLSELQAKYDSLVEEKNAALVQYEKASEQRAQELQALQKHLTELQERSGSASQHLSEAHAKHKQLAEDKAALEEAHMSSLEELAELHARVDALTKDLDAAKELQVRLDALAKEKSAVDEAHAKSQSIITDLQARHDSLLDDQTTAEDAHARALDALKNEFDNASKMLLVELQSKYDSVLEEKSAADDAHAMSKSIIADLQARHDSLLKDKNAAEDAHTRAIDALKRDNESETRKLLDELQSKYDALANEKRSLEGSHQNELDNVHAQRDAILQQFSELEKTHASILADHLAMQEAHTKALETQQIEIEEKYTSLLDVMQSDADRMERERAIALNEKQSALTELVTLKKELHAEIDALRNELGEKQVSGPSSLVEITNKYEAIVAEKAAADAEHEVAVALLKDELKEQHDLALSELQAKHDILQQKLVQIDQEHGDALALLKEEYKAGHSNDVQALQQQLESLQKQYKDLTEQKAQMNQAHEEAISELMLAMESSQSDAVQQLQNKYDALVARLEAAQASHAAEIESLKQGDTEQHTFYRDLQSRHDKAVAEANDHTREIQRLQGLLEAVQEEASRSSKIAKQSELIAQEVEDLKDALERIEAERDEALAAAQDAEDRIETMKGEVVRKHLARVEPLEKENAALLDKIDRLEAIIAAGDRVARAAATLGEKRDINTLTEEDEEEESDTAPGAQVPKANGVHNDAVATQLAAMSETLHQLSELNNDAIAESSRTAQRLTEQD
ncbi:hypothetical protein ACEQ8H_008794 [Pleosporales sp. CAS-2024a]